MTQNIMTDIAGTLTDPNLVPKVLMPDFKAKGPGYVQRVLQGTDAEALALIDQIVAKYGLANRDQVAQFAYNQIANKSRDPLLLDLSGRVNTESMRNGTLDIEFYPDVPVALRNWRDMNMPVYTFSNGSELSQKTMFEAGKIMGTQKREDLSTLVKSFVDTALVGPKNDAQSYKNLCDTLRVSPRDVAYLSDSLDELDAAEKAGIPNTVYVARVPELASSYQGQHTLVRNLLDK